MLNTITEKLVNLDREAYAKAHSLSLEKDLNGSEKGAGAVEYGLVIAVVVTLVVGVAGVMSDPLQTFFKAAVGKVSEFLGGGAGSAGGG